MHATVACPKKFMSAPAYIESGDALAQASMWETLHHHIP
jgi:hypothetical protein